MRQVQRFEGDGPMRLGDLAVVTLAIVVPRGSSYLAIVDPLPGGLEIVQNAYRVESRRVTAELARWPQARPEFPVCTPAGAIVSCELFADAVPAGVYQYRYVARVRAAGGFAQRPPHRGHVRSRPARRDRRDPLARPRAREGGHEVNHRRRLTRALTLALAAPLAACLWAVRVPYDRGALEFGPVASTRITARDGTPLRVTLGPQGTRAEWARLDAVSPRLVDATVAAEDRRFWRHPGIDPLALVRAAWSDARAGRVVAGGSTLDPAVVRAVVARASHDPGKLREAVRAVRLEADLSKRDDSRAVSESGAVRAAANGIAARVERSSEASPRRCRRVRRRRWPRCHNRPRASRAAPAKRRCGAGAMRS